MRFLELGRFEEDLSNEMMLLRYPGFSMSQKKPVSPIIQMFNATRGKKQ